MTSDQMAPETLEALKGSIAKWESILSGTDEDHGWRNCPLCKMFLDRNCYGCPVYTASGMKNCNGTPYVEWQVFMINSRGNSSDSKWSVTDDESRVFAQAEVDYLKSLLPRQEP